MNKGFWGGTLDLVHAMEAEGDGGVLLTSTLGKDNWPASRFGRFTPGEELLASII